MEDQDRYSERIREIADRAEPVIDIDLDRYRPLLDGLDISDTQATELLLIIRDIMVMMIDLNVPAESWEQITDSIIQLPDADSGGLDS